MSGWYRIGEPGQDALVHLNTGRKASPEPCRMPRFEQDQEDIGRICGRISVALCDAPKCDKPICDLHRTKHTSKANTDYCAEHKHMAQMDCDQTGPGASCPGIDKCTDHQCGYRSSEAAA